MGAMVHSFPRSAPYTGDGSVQGQGFSYHVGQRTQSVGVAPPAGLECIAVSLHGDIESGFALAGGDWSSGSLAAH